MTISFYESNEPFYEFSNFFGKNGKKKYQFEIDGYILGKLLMEVRELTI